MGSSINTAGRVIVAVIATMLSMTGCAASSTESHESDAPYRPGTSYVGLQLRQRAALTNVTRYHQDVEQLLGNTLFQINGGPAQALTDAVLVGEITSVAPGLGFAIDGADAPSGTPVDFDDPAALWRTVHVDVEIDEVLTGDLRVGSTITVGFAFGSMSSYEDVAEDLRAMPNVLLFVDGDSAMFDYDQNIFAVVEDGAMLGVVSGADESITFPGLSTEAAKALDAAGLTLAGLRQAASQQSRIIVIG